MPIAWLGSNRYQIGLTQQGLNNHGSESHNLPEWEMDAKLIRPSRRHLVLAFV